MHRPSIQDVNWMSPVQEKSSPVQVKDPYGNLDMVIYLQAFGTQSVQSTPADNTRKRVWQFIKKEKKHSTTQPPRTFMFVYLFDLILYVPSINNLSVKQGRVFLG